MKKASEISKKLINLICKPEMRILPGHLAFYLVMTIIPLVALLVTLAAALSITTDTIRVTMADTIPEGILSILDAYKLYLILNLIKKGVNAEILGTSLNHLVVYLI